MSESPENMLSMEAVMEKLALSRAEVYRQVKDGKLKAEKKDHVLLFAEPDVDNFVETSGADKSALQEMTSEWLSFFTDRITNPEVELTDLTDKPIGDQINELGRRIMLNSLLDGVKDLYLDPMHEGDRLIYNTDDHRIEPARFKTALSTPLKAWFKSLVVFPEQETPGIQAALGRQTFTEPNSQFRITIIPTLLGEHIHIHFFPRYEDENAGAVAYTPKQRDSIRTMLAGRPGLILITGAVDLAAEQHRLALAHELSTDGRLVASLEHQVQYRSDHLVQLDVGAENGAGFNTLWPTVLNMRPDAIFFDECRDKNEALALIEGVYSGSVVVANVRSAGLLDALNQLFQHEINRAALARVLLGVVERITLTCQPPETLEKRPADAEEARHLDIPEGTEITVQSALTDNNSRIQRTVFGLTPMDAALKAWIQDTAAVPPLPASSNPSLSLSQAFRDLVINHEMAWEDAAPFLDEPQDTT